MKHIFGFLFLLASVSLLAQTRSIDVLTFEDCNNQDIFKNIRNNTHVLKYLAADGSVINIGDTLVIGLPSASTTLTTGIGAGDDVVIGTAKSKTKKSFSTIIMGRPGGVGNVLGAMSDEPDNNAPASMQGENVIVVEMRVIHKGSRKKPLRLLVLLGEPNGRAFGINKYMSVTDYEKSVLAGEIRSINAPLSREEAIAKLKEAKDLLDLEIIDQAEYDKLKKELTPIIINE